MSDSDIVVLPEPAVLLPVVALGLACVPLGEGVVLVCAVAIAEAPSTSAAAAAAIFNMFSIPFLQKRSRGSAMQEEPAAGPPASNQTSARKRAKRRVLSGSSARPFGRNDGTDRKRRGASIRAGGPDAFRASAPPARSRSAGSAEKP